MDANAQAADLLLSARHVVASTGAGLSKESGIPTFRGEGGLWTRDGEPPMNGYQRFLADPLAWWRTRLAEQARPSELGDAITRAQPNPGHLALVELERLGVLRHTITQNIDNLHRAAGSEPLTEIHGNRTLLRCLVCGRREAARPLTEDDAPRCPHCQGLQKPDTVMFGEPIPADALAACEAATAGCDLMLVVGTSGVVYPAAEFPLRVLRSGGALIEVNVDDTPFTPYAAVALRGPAGASLPLLVEAVRERLALRR